MDDSKLRSTPTLTRHPTFWFDDGSIVIYVQETVFKVHRSHLARHSEIFADLFSIPQPPESPTVEGCPIVHLPDRQSDFVDLLKALYDPLYFDTLAPNAGLTLRLDLVEGILRLSTKYFLTGLRKKCISILTVSIPLTLNELDHMQISSLKEARNDLLIKGTIRAIVLAQEMTISSVLPILYYIVVTRINPQQLLDGTTNLSWKDKTICMVAREKLRVAWKETYAWLHSFTPSPDCRRRLQDCRAARGLTLQWSQVKKAVQDDPLLPFSRWKSLGVCQQCQDIAMVQYTSTRNRLWKQLPSFFNLPLKPALKA